MFDDPPLIGLTGRRKTAAQLDDMPDSLGHLEADWYFADYTRGVLEAGGLPVHLPIDASPALYLGRLDGIVLSGGADIDPARYGQENLTGDPVEPERDAFEFELLEAAMVGRTPVLGICRGLQLINVAAGGSLHQNVPAHARYDLHTSERSHPVELRAGSLLHKLYGPGLAVNSLHHQTVDQPGPGLTVTAMAGDTVEGLEHDDLPIVAVQWHPEMMDGRSSDPIFSWIVEQASEFRNRRTH